MGFILVALLVAIGVAWAIAAATSRDRGGRSDGLRFLVIFLVVLALEGLLAFGACFMILKNISSG